MTIYILRLFYPYGWPSTTLQWKGSWSGIELQCVVSSFTHQSLQKFSPTLSWLTFFNTGGHSQPKCGPHLEVATKFSRLQRVEPPNTYWRSVPLQHEILYPSIIQVLLFFRLLLFFQVWSSACQPWLFFLVLSVNRWWWQQQQTCLVPKRIGDGMEDFALITSMLLQSNSLLLVSSVNNNYSTIRYMFKLDQNIQKWPFWNHTLHWLHFAPTCHKTPFPPFCTSTK